MPGQKRIDVALVIDASTSMRDDATPNGRTKLSAAIDAATAFMATLALPEDQAAVNTFNSEAQVVQTLTGPPSTGTPSGTLASRFVAGSASGLRSRDARKLATTAQSAEGSEGSADPPARHGPSAGGRARSGSPRGRPSPLRLRGHADQVVGLSHVP